MSYIGMHFQLHFGEECVDVVNQRSVYDIRKDRISYITIYYIYIYIYDDQS